MKTKFFKSLIVGIAIISQLQSFGQDNISLYSDINYEPIPDVSVKEYKSVQLRDTKVQNPNLALGVAIAGGGSRAEYYGIGVLIGLEEIKVSDNSGRNFLKEVDYFSTISGGCYAAGYYLTIEKNHLLKNNLSFGEFYFSKGEKYDDFIGKSANPLLIFNNSKNEKGSAYSMTKRLDFEVLQYDEYNLTNPNKFNKQMSMNDFFIKDGTSSQNPTLPMFVPNTTIYSNGERMPFMPHIIASLKINSSLEPNIDYVPLGPNGYNDGYDFPLKYAITASSAFPGVLPKVKFGVKDNDKILCFIDGGAVDNLGYKTLLELLNSDEKVKKVNKKALVIDCSGEGKLGRFIDDEKIGLLALLETATMYTVATKYLNHQKDIKNELCLYGIPEKNALVIGFSTIREHLKKIPKDAEYDKLKAEFANTEDKNSNWFNFYVKFKNTLIKDCGENFFKKDEQGEIILSSLASEKFKDFSPAQIFLLYEYAAQVDTKLKIYPDEHEMLILAGRYTVYLEKERIQDLLNTEKQ